GHSQQLHEHTSAHPRRTGRHLAPALLDLPGRGGYAPGLFRRRADGHSHVRRKRVHERPTDEAGPGGVPVGRPRRQHAPGVQKRLRQLPLLLRPLLVRPGAAGGGAQGGGFADSQLGGPGTGPVRAAGRAQAVHLHAALPGRGPDAGIQPGVGKVV
ncbi:MAG: hypothetical protein AVDCRST_MAG56-3718, partial [uncultured Cytophagales bacterium]